MRIDIVTRLEAHAHERGNSAAVVDRDAGGALCHTTWAELWSRVIGLAHRCTEVMNPGEVVLLVANRPLHYVTGFIGSLMSDAKVLPLSPTITSRRLDDVIEKALPQAAIVDPDVLSRCRGSIDVLVDTHDMDVDAASGLGAKRAGRDTRYGGLILETSGTSGTPKLVERSLSALNAVTRNCADALSVSPQDHVLAMIPKQHSYGIEHTLLAPIFGGALVEHVRGFTVSDVERAISRGDVTLLPGVPFMFEMLQDSTCWSDASRLPRLTYSAAGPLPNSVFETFQTRYGITIAQVYGSSELGTLTWSDPTCATFEPNSVGQPLPGVEILIKANGLEYGDGSAARGEIGRIAIRARSMLDRYIGEPSPFDEMGYFDTGDLGQLSERGNLFITGRSSVLINVAGHKVNPLEVEAALLEHPDVIEALVVPIRQSQTVSRPRALIVPPPGTRPDLGSIREWLRERLAPHQIPRRIDVRDNLARTATGKLIRSID